MTTTSLDAGIAALQKELSDLLHPDDFPGDWSIRQTTAYEQRRRELTALVQTARVAASTVADADRQLANETQWRDRLEEWRKVLCDELLSHVPRTSHDIGVRQNLTLSIMAIDRGVGVVAGTGYGLETLRLGALMRASGYQAAPAIEGQIFGRLPWFGALPEVADRIAKLTTRRTEAQRQLDEALLDEDARKRLAAQRTERANRLNAMSKADHVAALAAGREAASSQGQEAK